MLRYATIAAALTVGTGLFSAAMAQSLVVPGGQPAATAPGGTSGLAGPANIEAAIRGGKVVRARPWLGLAASPETTGSVRQLSTDLRPNR
ncbi:hypothetical protein F8B43_5651 [Methylorubrum populi]|uniref:Uncharacterized protein n=1 Tax=Methylorubrum populi TaxID=223967 RepID=A0A833MU85_9HYPH|nr:hypothetical protein F8B43_5651 [Methylorubrum populi]